MVVEQQRKIGKKISSIKWGKIHFLAPDVVEQLRWMPYLEIGIGIIFVIIKNMFCCTNYIIT